MNRTRTIRTAALIALPFLLLPAGVWASGAVYESTSDLQWWWVARWSLRAIYCSGALWGWLAGRPRWFYPWLGFASYEATAVLLSLFSSIVPDGHSLFGTLAISLFTFGISSAFIPAEVGPSFWPRDFLLFLLVFAPYLAITLGIGWRSSRRLLAVYAVFPFAALTLPLLFFVERGNYSSEDYVALLPSAVTAAIFAVWYSWLASDESMAQWDWGALLILVHGVLFAAAGLLLGYFLKNPPLNEIAVLFGLVLPTYVGWMILSITLLLPPLLQLPGWLFRTGFRWAFE